MIFPCLETSDYYFVWKPHHIPSSFGKEKSFLEYISQSKIQTPEIVFPDGLGFFLENNFPIEKYTQTEISKIIKNQKSEFTQDQEYGLLNRLDNETAGYLYFAKNMEIYKGYKNSQNQGILQKLYLAQVVGNPLFKSKETSMVIDFPIMHHKSDDKKMLTIKTENDKKNGRGQQKHQKTSISLIEYDSKTNISTLAVSISKGVRHQIRVHLASIGCAIIGDTIYGKNKSDRLCLRSIGFKIKKDGQIL